MKVECIRGMLLEVYAGEKLEILWEKLLWECYEIQAEISYKGARGQPCSM